MDLDIITEDNSDATGGSSKSRKSSIYLWKGFSGDLGLSTFDIFNTVDIVKVSLGSGHSLYQSRDGNVYVSGDNSKGQLGISTLDVKIRKEPIKVTGLIAPVIDIACGANHCAVINDEGKAFCWGDSSSGQCGVGSLDLILSPTPVLQEIQDGFCKEHGLPKSPLLILFESISCGAQHTLAVSTDGEIWSWGCGIALGLGEILHAPAPRRIEALKGHLAIGVCCGKNHSMVMVLKGDKSKSPPTTSSLRSPVKAKEIEVDKHYPSRCKSCKKEIFSYTDTPDMCIIDALHECGPRLTSSDDSTVVGDESFPLSSDDTKRKSITDDTNAANNVDSPINSLVGASEVSEFVSNSTTREGENLHKSGPFESALVEDCDVASSASSASKDQISSESTCSLSHEIMSSPEEMPGDDFSANFSSVPDITLDGSLLCLPPADTFLVETERQETSPMKSSEGSIQELLSASENDVTKVELKSDNSVSVSTEDYSFCSNDDIASTLSSDPECSAKNKHSEGDASLHQPDQDASEACPKKVSSTQVMSQGISSQDNKLLAQSHSDNPLYAKSVSIESDDIVWKRQSASVDDVSLDFKSSQQFGRPSSPSSVSVKSLNFISQSDAMEYLNKQFEDDEADRPKRREINKKEMLENKLAALDSTTKPPQTDSVPYTSMVMEQVKSMTNRAFTNFPSLNVLRSLSGDSPTMEMTTSSLTKAGQADQPPDSSAADVSAISETDQEVELRSKRNSSTVLRDDVFSSPESCSMISSVGSLTCEDVGDSGHVELTENDDNFHSKLKSGTFIEWRQEMSSVGERSASMASESDRRSLRTIEMQKRNLSSSTLAPSAQKAETKQSPHRPVITTTEIWVWGHNSDGQLGIGDTIDRAEPIWLKSLSGRNVMKLAAGDSHSMVLTDNSQIYTWGLNSHGQLGQNKTTDCPSRVKFPKGNMVWDIAAGSQHSIFLGDTASGPPEIFYSGKQPTEATNASLKKTLVPSPIGTIKKNAWIIRITAGGTKCCCKVLDAPTPMSDALFELASSERSFYGQLIKTSNLLLRPLRRSSFYSSLDVYPYKGTLQNMSSSFGLFTTKIGKGVTDLTATIQHDDCPSLTHFIKEHQEFIKVFRNYSRTFSDFLAVGGFDYCTKTGSEFFTEIQGSIQELPSSKEKTHASSSLFLRAMSYPFFRLTEYSRLISAMAASIQQDSEEKKVFQNTVLDWDSLKLNFSSEHKLASNTKAFWDSINLRLADSLRQPSRRVLKESKSHALTLPSAGRFSSQLFVLFNDVFLHSQNNVQVLYPLATLWVESGASDGAQQNMLIVTSPEERFEFNCPSSVFKTEWLMAFKSAISRVLMDEKSLDSPHSSGERFTPPLIRHATHKFVRTGIYKDASYNGTMLSGRIHGLGEMKWPDGSSYTGNFKLGLMHGQGTFTQVKGQNKETQQGTWKDGRMNGPASIVYANGDMYEGHMKDGQRYGHGMLQTGRIKSNCASVYIGEWIANLRHGYGVEDHILKGEKYMGLWSEDSRHGNGVMVTLDGMYFEGNFVHNKLTGFGVMISDDDTLYEGDFVGITYLSGKGTLTLPAGDKLEGAFSGSLNEGLKINGTFLKAANTTVDVHQPPSHGPRSRYFGRLCIPADGKWTNMFVQSYASLGQSSTSQQRNDTEKAWEAVAVMVSEGLTSLKKQQGRANSTKGKIQQKILEGLDKIPSHGQDKLDSVKVLEISVYLTKAFESSYHPLGQLMNTLVDVFRASYIGVGAHPRLLHHAVREVKSYIHRVYRVIRLLFPTLPATEGPVPVHTPATASKQMLGVLPDPSAHSHSFDEDDSDVTIFTAAGLVYPILLPKIYPPLFDLYALYNERSDDRYWERVTKLNRQGDVGLMAYLGIEQHFWLIQDILDEGKTQALSTIKDKCYAEAVDQLQQLSTAFSPVDKLKVIEQTFNQITQTVTSSLGDDVMWCMDDLFPIFQFVVVRAKLHHLGAEINLVEDLMESHLEHGEYGIMLTTLKACYFQIQNEKMPHH